MESNDHDTEKPTGRTFLRKHLALRHIIGIVVGAIAGFLYYRIIGCSTGACPLNSNPWLMSGMGILMGYLISDLFIRRKRTE